MDKSKAIYNAVFWSLLIGIYGLYFMARWKELVPEFVKEWDDFVFIPATIAMHFIAAMACKMAGVSKEEVETKVFRRLRPDEPRVLAPRLERPNQEISKFQRGLLLFIGGVFCLGFGIGTVAWIFTLLGDPDVDGHWIGPVGLLLFGTVTAILYFSKDSAFTLLTDERGVHGYRWPFERDAHGHRSPRFQPVIIAWRDIEGFQIVTKRNATGEITSICAQFQDLSGKTILSAPQLQSLPPETREEFFAIVKHKVNLE